MDPPSLSPRSPAPQGHELQSALKASGAAEREARAALELSGLEGDELRSQVRGRRCVLRRTALPHCLTLRSGSGQAAPLAPLLQLLHSERRGQAVRAGRRTGVQGGL
jgi:hypothetical protein